MPAEINTEWYWQQSLNKLLEVDIIAEKNKRTGLITTVLVHIGLLLIFAFFGMTYMEPPPEEEGITINFGYSEVGRNNNEQNNPTPTPTPPTETQQAEPTPQEVVEEEIITQDVEEAPSIQEDKKKEKVEEVPEPKKEEPKPDKSLSEAINKWKNTKTESGGGDGETDQIGNQGNPDGDKDSKKYSGGGNGDGPSYTLEGRSMVKSPTIKDNSQETGKVVVDIIVDKYGKVVRATPGARGSTTASSQLYKIAKEAALNTKFNANPDAREEQQGQMTFIFILN